MWNDEEIRDYECTVCSAFFHTDSEDYEEILWGHLQMEHEEIFEECQDWETPFMIEEYYEEI